MKTEMKMTYELITPEIASAMLENNPNNRSVSNGTVKSYAEDMLAGNWDENTGVAISVDANGNLRDGQHRLEAIVLSGVSIHSWVCRNVASDGIYDNNRKRSASDQISILRDDFEGVYKSPRYISIARAFINHTISGKRDKVSPKQIIDFTEEHKEDLDGFFLNIPQTSVPKLSLAVVHMALFMAYMGGVDIETILNFYDVFTSGMSTTSEEFPIIAYRNYLKDSSGNITTTPNELSRCQYALKKYITKSCTRRSISPQELIWDYPF